MCLVYSDVHTHRYTSSTLFLVIMLLSDHCSYIPAVVDDPNSPAFDLEKYLSYLEASSKK